MTAGGILAPTIGVCGFGRCGSTMVMAMLDAGGIEPVQGSSDRGYELDSLEDLIGYPTDRLAGRSVKLLDGIAHYPLPKAAWRFVWLDRDVRQQAKSFEKFIRSLGILPAGHKIDQKAVADSYVTDRPRVLSTYAALGPVLVMRYEDVLNHPGAGASLLADFVPGLAVAPAAAAVHRRTGDCRVGMVFERYGVFA